MAGLLAVSFLACPATSRAGSPSSSAQDANNQAQLSAVDSLTSQLALFRNATEQWVSVNVTSAWNENQSLTAKPFGTYPPILLYVGATPALCGAPATTSQTVNLQSAGFVTANFSAPYSGEYCAMIYPNSGVGTQSGPIGANGGTNDVSVTSVIAYFVAGTSSDTEEQLLQNSSSDYTVSHIAPLLSGNFSAGGYTIKYTPKISNSGTAASEWQEVQP